jgi:hypothetical protein
MIITITAVRSVPRELWSLGSFDAVHHGVARALERCAKFSKDGAEHQRDRQAALAIYSAMPMDIMQHLISKEIANDVWDTIKTLQLGHGRVREASLQSMLKAYENLQMGDDELVEQFAGRVVPLVNGIRLLDEILTEISVV